MDRIDALDQGARVERLLGNNYNAAIMYARAIRLSWRDGYPPSERTSRLMVRAAAALAACGMAEDAFHGVRMLALAHIANGRADLASDLVANIAVVCAAHTGIIVDAIGLSRFVDGVVRSGRWSPKMATW
jgi:hypothetical protein